MHASIVNESSTSKLNRCKEDVQVS